MTELKYIDSIGESDKNMLLQKERKKAGIFNDVQQNSFNQVITNASGAAQETLSHENLKQSISVKDISVTFSKQNQKDHTSKILFHFSTIFVNNLKQDYVLCDSCMLRIAYKYATGTGGMQKHITFCSQKSP